MKSQKSIIFGVILMFLFLNIASADCDWDTFGTGWTPLWNKQISPQTCYGLFNETNMFQSNMGFGYSQTASIGTQLYTQPLVARLNSTEDVRLIFTASPYLEIYDKNLQVVSEKNVGNILDTSILVMDFFNDGTINDIALFKQYNNSLYALQIYSYSVGTGILNLTWEYNFTGNANFKASGLRKQAGKIVFVWNDGIASNSTITIINATYRNDLNLTSKVGNSASFYYPVAFIDMDRDGRNEYMTYDGCNLDVIDENGNVDFYDDRATCNAVGGSVIDSATIFAPECYRAWWEFWTGSCNVDWRVVYLQRTNIGLATPSTSVVVKKLDGSSLWSKTLDTSSGSSNAQYGEIAITDDYDGDGFADIYAVQTQYRNTNIGDRNYWVLKGNNGNTLAGRKYVSTSPFDLTDNNFLTIADLNHNGKDDFIFVQGTTLWTFEPYLNRTLFNYTLASQSAETKYCVPADLNFDGTQDIICSFEGRTFVFSSNYTNQNAYIQNISYLPDLTIQVNTSLTMYVTATDEENNFPISCIVDCFGNGNWSAETGTTLSCYYGTLGIFNNTIGCRDVYHAGEYDYLSANIIVTPTGAVCDNDGNCDLGENVNNCPNDCFTAPPTQQAEGGTPIPTKLVDTENTEQGLLPEIYYGILGFFSYVASPLIILVFVIFFALIILALGTIIRKIATRVGGR